MTSPPTLKFLRKSIEIKEAFKSPFEVQEDDLKDPEAHSHYSIANEAFEEVVEPN